MPLPSNGISQDVIREMMPPYHLSTDLLAGAVTALPPPPPDASATWRRVRLTRLVQEIGGLMPADAPQARIAAQIVVVREATDDTFARSNAPGLAVEQVCRLRRTAADLTRSAATLERLLARRQAKPAPFFGTVLADGVDIAALDAVWCNPHDERPAELIPGCSEPGADPVGPRQGDEAASDVTPTPAGEPAPAAIVEAEPTADQPGAAPPMEDAAPSPAPMPLPADGMAAEARAPRERSSDRAARRGRDTGATPEWVVTRLDEGPGWTREVARRATGAGAAPGSAA